MPALEPTEGEYQLMRRIGSWLVTCGAVPSKLLTHSEPGTVWKAPRRVRYRFDSRGTVPCGCENLLLFA
jgi:hypothetical protein